MRGKGDSGSGGHSGNGYDRKGRKIRGKMNAACPRRTRRDSQGVDKKKRRKGWVTLGGHQKRGVPVVRRVEQARI